LWCDASTFEEVKKTAQKEKENYLSTVQALLALGNHLCWDEQRRRIIPDSYQAFGKKMPRKDNPPCTPDLLIQRTDEYGILTEAKNDLPKDKRLWKEEFKQLEAYCEDLGGWFTPSGKITNHDVVFLTQQQRAHGAVKYIDDQMKLPAKEKEIDLSKDVIVISFIRSDQRYRSAILLRKERSDFSSPGLFDKEPTQDIPLRILQERYGDLDLFYDEPPIEPYLLFLLWGEIFDGLASDIERNEKLQARPIPIDVKELTTETQKLWGPPQIYPPGQESQKLEIPKVDWIRKALNTLVDLGLAKPDKNDKDQYTILYRSMHGDLFERFVKLCWEKHKSKKKKTKGKRKAKKPFRVGKEVAEKAGQLGLFREKPKS